MTEREKFEAWFESQYSAKPKQLGDEKGVYATMFAEGAWKAWQARSLIATKQTYEPAPYWMNPDFQMPKAGS